MKISLCMIVGNEAAIIARCLDSAVDSFDELCLVRAIGESQPDSTISIAQSWCILHEKTFRSAIYQNTRSGLPHVDNFAAARNISFSLATGDWVFWLDADDQLQGDVRAVLEKVGNQADVLRVPYVMPTGAVIPRERIIRKGHGTWHNPVHETCTVTGNIAECVSVEVHHLPTHPKQESSATRNLAILEDTVKDLPRSFYYFHEELFRANNPRAAAAGVQALKILPASMVVERYEVMLNLASLDKDRQLHWIWQAIQLCPTRREAWGYMVQYQLATGNLDQARLFLRTLCCIPEPDPKPWTHRGMWYGWGADYMLVKYLRLSGKTEEADAQHKRFLECPEYREHTAKYEGAEA